MTLHFIPTPVKLHRHRNLAWGYRDASVLPAEEALDLLLETPHRSETPGIIAILLLDRNPLAFVEEPSVTRNKPTVLPWTAPWTTLAAMHPATNSCTPSIPRLLPGGTLLVALLLLLPR